MSLLLFFDISLIRLIVYIHLCAEHNTYGSEKIRYLEYHEKDNSKYGFYVWFLHNSLHSSYPNVAKWNISFVTTHFLRG